MENIEFIKSLDKDKVYIFGFNQHSWTGDQISEFFKITKELGLQGMGVYAEGFQIFEPIGIDKEKLKELLK